jgi:hypothetical protein
MSVKMEDMFRKKLENHEVKPSDRVWERIESKLDEGEERSGFRWYLAVAAGIALLFALAVIFTPDHTVVDTPVAAEDSVKTNIPTPFEIPEVTVAVKGGEEGKEQENTPEQELENTWTETRTIAQTETPVKRMIQIEGLEEFERFTEGQTVERPVAFIDPFNQRQPKWYVKAEAPQQDSAKSGFTVASIGDYAVDQFTNYIKGERLELPKEKIQFPAVNKLLANINNPFNSPEK